MKTGFSSFLVAACFCYLLLHKEKIPNLVAQNNLSVTICADFVVRNAERVYSRYIYFLMLCNK